MVIKFKDIKVICPLGGGSHPQSELRLKIIQEPLIALCATAMRFIDQQIVELLRVKLFHHFRLADRLNSCKQILGSRLVTFA